MFKIIFVCTANICRSPMAEVILEKLIRDNGLEEVMEVESCGTWAVEGRPASSLAQLVAKEHGFDLSAHRSQPVSLNLVKTADLILCMTPSHKTDLVQIFPHLDSKILLLKEFAREKKPLNPAIADPVGMSLSFYRQIFKEILTEVERIWPTLKELALKKVQVA